MHLFPCLISPDTRSMSGFAVRKEKTINKKPRLQKHIVENESLKRNGRRSYLEGFYIFLIARRLLLVHVVLLKLSAAALFVKQC